MEHERIENESAEIMLPGFRFHPTDEELVGFYLRRKVQHKPLSIELIKQLDIYKYDPWDLPKMATTGEREWYFYCPRDRKYRNSNRPNRVTGAGFWKATGTDRPVYSSDGSRCIGLKKSLVFYRGRAARGTKTDWMMHEFRLPSASPKKYLDKIIPANEAWAICRIFKKASTNAQRALSLSHQSWISPVISDNGGAAAPNHTMNPTSVGNIGSVSCSYTTAATSNKTNAPLQLGFCSDLQQSSSMATAAATTFSLLNSQWPSSIGIQPLAVDDASSSLLLDMSSSVLQGGVGGFHASAAEPSPTEPCDGLISAVGAAETMISAVNWDQESGVVRFPNYSNLVWDYSSPCPSELSTAYSTSNCSTLDNIAYII